MVEKQHLRLRRTGVPKRSVTSQEELLVNTLKQPDVQPDFYASKPLSVLTSPSKVNSSEVLSLQRMVGNQATRQLLQRTEPETRYPNTTSTSEHQIHRRINKQLVASDGYFKSSPEITGKSQQNYNRAAVLTRLEDYYMTDTTISTRGMTFQEEYDLSLSMAGSLKADLQLQKKNIDAAFASARSDTKFGLGTISSKITTLVKLINQIQDSPFENAKEINESCLVLEKMYSYPDLRRKVSLSWHKGAKNDLGYDFALTAMIDVFVSGKKQGVIHIHYEKGHDVDYISIPYITSIHFKYHHDKGAANSKIIQNDLIIDSHAVAENQDYVDQTKSS